MIRRALDLIVPHGPFIVLLLVASAAASLWVRGERAIADRDQAVASAEMVCAAALSSFVPEDTPARDRGLVCRDAVKGLADFRLKAIADSNALLVQAESDRLERSRRDVETAVAAANRTADAARRMEEANAKIGSDDRVDGDWFARLNDLAGLRP